ncbi:MAG: hypothetical protein S4CHLAM81_08130 [Chlamydiales bacterium]|nr:hypothetical protein [Chlamydiales bacterium]MCH9635595.1 hypothetical protein [Chlamydiales bacterium]
MSVKRINTEAVAGLSSITIMVAGSIAMIVSSILALQGKLNIPPAGARVMVCAGIAFFLVLLCTSPAHLNLQPNRLC